MVKKIGRNISSLPKKGKKIARDGSELKSSKKITRSIESKPTPLRTVFSTSDTSFFPGGVPFSEFDARGTIRVDDIIVGLRNNENSQFFLGAGLLDSDDNFIIGYSSVGANAINYINFENSVSGDAPIIAPLGQDGNIAITLRSRNDAPVNIYTNDNYFNLNDTNPIYGVTIDGTLTGATDIYVPSALAVKTYVDNTFALVDPTYVTNTDERYRLPYSQPLSILSTGFATITTTTGIMGSRIHTGTANQITVTNGNGASGNPTYSLPSTLITPGTLRTTSTLQIGSGGAVVTSISTDGTMASNLDTLLSSQKAIKTYVDTADTTIKNQTFITNTDQTATLPNSQPLSALATGIMAVTTTTGIVSAVTLTGTANEITVTGGTGTTTPTFSLPSTLIAPGTFQATTSLNIGGAGATVTSISIDGTLAADSDTLLSTQKAIKTYVDSQTTLIGTQTFVTNTNEVATLPNSVQLKGTANQITNTAGTLSIPTTFIAPGTFQATTSINIAGSGATVTSISTDGTLTFNSDALLSTQKAIKTYVDTAETATKSYSYITKTDNTANLPNSVPLSGLSSGFLSNTTTTGVLNARTHTGTANQIDIANGNGVSGNPTYTLSSTMIAPGTLNVTTTFTVGSTVSVDSISNSASASSATQLMTANATQMAIAAQISGAKSFRGGYDASTNLFPATGGSGIAGAIQAGDVWEITVAGTLGGTSVYIGNTILALTNVPGQTAANWAVSVTGVASFNSRVGIITPTSGDYSFSLISGTAAVAQGGTANTSVGSAGTFAYSDGSKYVFSPMTVPITAGSSGTYWRSNGTNVLSSTIQVADVPTLNQNTTGQAGSVANSLTINNGGAGAASGATYNGGSAVTISYNTVGASPLAGSSSITTVGTISSGTWQGTAIAAIYGGTGQTTYTTGDLLYASSSSALSRLADVATGNVLISGGIGVAPSWGKVDLTAAVSGILPTANGGTGNSSGQSASVANALTMNNSGSGAISGSTFDGSATKTISYNTIGASPLAGSSSLTTVGTITSGTWTGTTIAVANGGTGATAVGASGTLAQSNGSIYTFTTAKYPSTSTLGKLLRGDGTDWLATTASYPDSIGANQILYSSSLNVVGGLTAGSAAVLTCNNGSALGWKTLTDGQIIIGSTAGSPNSATLTQGTGITITNASNSITISATGGGGGLTFNTVTASTQAMAVNNAYYSTYAGTCVMTLPSTAVTGSIVQIITDSSHLIQTAQNSGQLIYCGAQNGVSLVTTTGVGGSITTISPNTVITLCCIVTNTTWEVIYTNNSYNGV